MAVEKLTAGGHEPLGVPPHVVDPALVILGVTLLDLELPRDHVEARVVTERSRSRPHSPVLRLDCHGLDHLASSPSTPSIFSASRHSAGQPRGPRWAIRMASSTSISATLDQSPA